MAIYRPNWSPWDEELNSNSKVKKNNMCIFFNLIVVYGEKNYDALILKLD